MKHIVAGIKNYIRQRPGLYIPCYALYTSPRTLRAALSRAKPKIKYYIQQVPGLYGPTRMVYHALRRLWATTIGFLRRTVAVMRGVRMPTKTQIRQELSKHPRILLYVRLFRPLLKGDVRSGLHKIFAQIQLDWRNWRVLRRNRMILEKLYKEAVLCCIQHRVHRWWSFFPNTKFESIQTFQLFLRECILRRAGDYTQYLKIKENLKLLSGMTTPQEEFFDTLARHYGEVIADLDSGLLLKELALDPKKRPFLIGFSVWGERYLNMFINYCLPSLLTEGNLGALCKERQPVLFIHTYPQDMQRIEQSDVMRRVRTLGVAVHYQMVNEELVKYFKDEPESIYWHLGMVQSIDLYAAKTLGADYHLLMPDTIYSESHFAGLLGAVARGHKAIIRLILSTRMEGICPAVEPYRNNGVIAIPAPDLAALSVLHVHTGSKSWIMTHKNLETELSNMHVMVWEGKETLHMLSAHQTILYLDREIMHKMPRRYFMTLDSELDKIIPDEYPIYRPKPEDAICLVEATTETQRAAEPQRTELAEFCRIFWFSTQQSMAYWKVFEDDVVDSINRQMLSGRSYMGDEEISHAKEVMHRALLESYPLVSTQQMHHTLELLQTARTHPDAKPLQSLIDETIQSICSEEEKYRRSLGVGQEVVTLQGARVAPNANTVLLGEFYKEAILCCVRNRVHRWWSFFSDTKFDSLPALQVFLRDCVLRRAGDYKEFLRIRNGLKHMSVSASAQEEFYDKLAQHYAAVIEEINAGFLQKGLTLDPEKRPFLIAFSAWGEHFLHMLLNYCLPSLLTEGNFGTLCKERQLILLIHTNPEGMQRIDLSDIVRRMRDMGISVIYQMVNEELVRHFGDDPGNKYWHLGMVQSVDLHCARTLGADYHLLMPDTIYSESHFAGILAAADRGHKVITRLGLSTRMEGICPAVDAYRKDGVIAIPAGDLAALSVANVHSACASWLATNRDMTTELPNMYMAVWEGKDAIHMLSPHQTILYLDREVMQKVPDRFYLTLDGELDKIIPEEFPLYCPKQQDGIYLVEVTSEKQRPTKLTRNPIKEFCRMFWYSANDSMTYWKFFDEDIIDPINRDMVSNRGYMDDAEIKQAKQSVKNALLAAYPVLSAEQAQLALELLQTAKTHPSARYMTDLIEEAVHAIHGEEEKVKQHSAA